MPQIESGDVRERILINLKKQGMLSYDLLKENCDCNRRDFAISMRQLLRSGYVMRHNGVYGVKVKNYG